MNDAMSHEFSKIRSESANDEWQDSNPCASPGAWGPHLISTATAIGIWRLDNTLVMHRDAEMPRRCFRTNSPCMADEARIYAGSSTLVNWTTRITLVMLTGMSSAAIALFDNPSPGSLAGASAIFLAGLFFAWLCAPLGAKEIHITYYHSRLSRRRRFFWRCAGLIITAIGVGLILLLAQYEPNALHDTLLMASILLAVAGGCLLIPMSTGLGAMHFQGDYLLLSGCGRGFIESFPECTLEFRSTLGSFVRRHFR